MPVSSRMKWVVFSFLFCCAVCLPTPTRLAGQSTSTGTVVGLVTDETDAPVVGATVSLIDHSTGTTKGTTTNDVGRYVFVNVNPGMYDIQVEKTGFNLARFAQQEVSIGRQLTVNAKLKVGSVTDTVVVEASGATLQTLNAAVGTTIGFQDLQELPNLSRDVSSLLTLQPGIAPNGSVAGAVRDQNTFQLDGGNNSSDMDGTMNTYTPSFASAASSTAGGPTGVMPTPVESIEEFKVNVSNQTADFNGSSGAQVQLVTRRGGNGWHGAAYEYYLGSNFGANTWLNNHTPTRDQSLQSFWRFHRWTGGTFVLGRQDLHLRQLRRPPLSAEHASPEACALSSVAPGFDHRHKRHQRRLQYQPISCRGSGDRRDDPTCSVSKQS